MFRFSFFFRICATSAALLAISFPLWCLTPQEQNDSLTFVQADWRWTSLGRGGETGYASLNIFGGTQSISVVRYRASKFKTGIMSAPGPLASTTDSLAQRAGAIAAVNGSYFNVKTLEHATFFCAGGKVLSLNDSREMFRCDGVLALKNGCAHKVVILPYDKGEEDVYCKRYKTAIVSGPVLITDGSKRTQFDMENKFFGRRHPRTFLGVTGDGWVYLVVVDGRFPGRGDGATIPELVTIAKWFGLSDAINLDGGGSSTLWTDPTGVVNHPYDNRKFDHKGMRRVPNIITVSR